MTSMRPRQMASMPRSGGAHCRAASPQPHSPPRRVAGPLGRHPSRSLPAPILLHKDWAHPCPHLRRDRVHPTHVLPPFPFTHIHLSTHPRAQTTRLARSSFRVARLRSLLRDDGAAQCTAHQPRTRCEVEQRHVPRHRLPSLRPRRVELGAGVGAREGELLSEAAHGMGPRQ